MADQIERHIRQSDVLLQYRRVAAPLRETVAEDQTIIAESERVLEERFLKLGREMCSGVCFRRGVRRCRQVNGELIFVFVEVYTLIVP